MAEPVNTAPVLAQPAPAFVAENAASGTLVARVIASDAEDKAAALRYAITAGNDDGLFAIDAKTGAVTIASGKHLDHESAAQHQLTVQATDTAGLPSAARTLTVNVRDVNEATGITASTSAKGTLKAGDTITFTLATESAVAVTGTPSLTLNNGGTATYAGLDGNGRPTFAYTVASGDDVANLTVTGLDPHGGSLDVPGRQGFGTVANVAVGSVPRAVTSADLNGDGKADLLVANLNSDTVSVRLGQGDGTLGTAADVQTGLGPRSVTVADLNGDGKADLLVANEDSNTVSVRLGRGDGTFTSAADVQTGTTPWSVTSADLNGDGNADLLVANRIGNTVSVRLGKGDGTFTAAADVQTGFRPLSVTSADVNGDGKADLLVTNEGNATVSVRLGNGDGTFTAAADVQTGTSPYWVTSADVNGDGKVDLLVANFNSDTVSVRLGKGDGTFTNAADVRTGHNPGAVTSADVNGDGKADLLVANHFDGTVSVRLGNGDGTFTAAANVQTGNNPFSVTSADLNGDGKADLIVGNSSGGSVSVALNTSTFGLAFDTAGVSSATSGAATGRAIDASAPALTGAQTALAKGMEDTAYTVSRAQLLQGWTDAGKQTLSVSVPTTTSGTVKDNGDGTYTITPAKDLNGPVTLTYSVSDGTNTVAATRGFTLDATNDTPVLAQPAPAFVAEDAASGTLVARLSASDAEDQAASLRYAITSGNDDGLFAIDPVTGAVTVAAGKHLDHESAARHQLTVQATDGTGLPSATKTLTVNVRDVNEATGIIASTSATGTLKAGDTVTLTLATESAVTVTGTPTLTLNTGGTAAFAGLDTAGRPTFTYTVASGDDVANLTVTGLDPNGGSLDVAGTVGFAAAPNVNLRYYTTDVTVADVNGDGKLDLLAAVAFENTVRVRLGDGAGGFSGANSVKVGKYPLDPITADVNGDGKLDLLTVNLDQSTVSVRLGDGAGGFSGTTEVGVGKSPLSLTVADVDGDGKLDLLTTSRDDGTVSVRLGDGKGGFNGTTEVGVGTTARDVITADVDGDGRLDMLVANRNSNTVSVRLGDGKGGFSGTTEIRVGTNPTSVTAADVNGDGKLDLLTANEGSNTVSVRLGDGEGGFSGTTEIRVGTNPYSVVTADLNGDEKLDLLTANRRGGNLSISLGDGKGGFDSTTTVSAGDDPQNAIAADLNGDGKLDLITANYVSNFASVSLNTSTFGLRFDTAGVSTRTAGAVTGYAVDAVAPLAPTILAPAAGATVDGTPTFSGTAEAGSTVTVYVGTTALGTAKASEAGTWSLEITQALSSGAYGFHATATDATGNTSPDSSIVGAVVDNLAPPAPVILIPGEGASLNDTTPSVSGTAEAGSTVTIYVDGKEAGTAEAGDAGGWSLDLPSALAQGAHRFTATATDAVGNVGDVSGTVTARVNTLAPALTGAQAQLDPGIEDTAFTVTTAQLLRGFTDAEGTTFTVKIVSVDHGTIAEDGRGGYTVTPDADHVGPVTIRYTVGDGDFATPATLSTVLAAVNDAPTASGLTQTLRLDEDAAATRLLTGKVGLADAEGDSLTATLTLSDAAAGTLLGAEATGTPGVYTVTGSAAEVGAALAALTFAPAPNYKGTLDVSVAISDGVPKGTTGTQPSGTVSITVDSVNDRPEPADDTARLTQVMTATGNVIAGTPGGDADTDIDGDLLHVAAIGYRSEAQAVATEGTTSLEGRYGTLTIASDGDYSYQAGIQGRLAVGQTGTDSFTYTVDDGNGGTDTATLTLTVTGTARGTSGNDFSFLTGSAHSASGGRGSDVYVVDGASDRPTESGNDGNDLDSVLATANYTLATNADIELLRSLDADSTAGLSLTGNSRSQKIYGDAGANTIDGKGGMDVLRGYGGADTFVFSSKLGAGNVDHIQDFSAKDDTIALDAAIFRAAGREGTLNANLFKDITDGAALDANDRILYDRDTGQVSYDADGSGATKAVVFAILDTKPTLTFQDFTVV